MKSATFSCMIDDICSLKKMNYRLLAAELMLYEMNDSWQRIFNFELRILNSTPNQKKIVNECNRIEWNKKT